MVVSALCNCEDQCCCVVVSLCSGVRFCLGILLMLVIQHWHPTTAATMHTWTFGRHAGLLEYPAMVR
ncbi:hypothetical protein GCK32_000292 [Trichostrongylus colubriformis]|uniref:Uncharacterized protein n=1 Tax=Trichostrongylus colubriformis TaxID=6319 RepID=A0AAN8IG49_TRICO